SWQPVLQPALELEVLQTGEGTGRMAASLLGASNTSLPEEPIAAYVQELAHYVDDERWLARLSAALDLRVSFPRLRDESARGGEMTVQVEGASNLLDD